MRKLVSWIILVRHRPVAMVAGSLAALLGDRLEVVCLPRPDAGDFLPGSSSQLFDDSTEAFALSFVCFNRSRFLVKRNGLRPHFHTVAVCICMSSVETRSALWDGYQADPPRSRQRRQGRRPNP